MDPEPFARAEKDGALLCTFCPRRCRLTSGRTGVCGALSFEGSGLRATRPPGTFRLRTLGPDLSGLSAFPRDRVVLAVDSGGSGLEKRTVEPFATEDMRFTPEQVVFVARAWDAAAVHLVSDDPVFGVAEGHEIVTIARAAGLGTALTTTGFLTPTVREILADGADVLNLRIWSTSPTFYVRRFGARVEPVLAFVEWLGARRSPRREATVPIVPGANDAPYEIERLARWLARCLGPRVPIHFEAGAPGVRDEALAEAVEIVRAAGLRATAPPPRDVAPPRRPEQPHGLERLSEAHATA